MQNNAKVGGVLSIISGVFGVLGLFLFIFLAVVMVFLPDIESNYNYSGTEEGVFTIIAVVYVVMGICCAVVGALAIVGGVFALRKRHWGWALAGSIGATIVFFPCGVPAIIFTAMSKPEFQATAPLTPAPMEKIVG